MRSFGVKVTLFLVILGAGVASTAWALGHHDRAVETVYVMPSSVSMPVATSYVVSTGWVEPTAYAVPTYYTSAYWMDPVVLAQPAYAATAYVRRGLLGRRWVEDRPVLTSYATTYVPSAYYAAPSYRATSSYVVTDRMVVPSSYVASADCVCPTTVASAVPMTREPARIGTAAPSTRSRSVQSQPEDLSPVDSDVPPVAADGAAAGQGSGRGDSSARQTAPGTLPPDLPYGENPDNTPPVPPRPAVPQGGRATPGAAPRNTQASPATGGATNSQGGGQSVLPRGGTNPNTTIVDPKAARTNAVTPDSSTTAPGTTGGANQPSQVPAPTAPGGPDANGLQDVGAPPEIRREVQRPIYSNTQAARPRFPSILIGTVLTATGHEPEEGVRISVRNASGSSKAATTNAFGRFAVRLADGDWSVDVTMPSGSVYEVSQVRVANGVITDLTGRRVPSLEITR